MEGTGFLGEHAAEVYRLRDDDLYLVGTSEVPLAGYHAGEILDLAAGPRRYAGWSSCFRREAGSYGKDTRGIIRVHQFDKVEMFVYCRPDDAEAEHERLLGWEERMLAAIELSYRVIDVSAGNLGSSVARKFEREAWSPSQGTYRELTSTSNCTTFQSRRLNEHPLPRRRLAPAGSGHAQRHARHHALDRRDPGEPPAGRRVRTGARGAAPVPGWARGPRRDLAERTRRSTGRHWLSTMTSKVSEDGYQRSCTPRPSTAHRWARATARRREEPDDRTSGRRGCVPAPLSVRAGHVRGSRVVVRPPAATRAGAGEEMPHSQ